MAKKNTKIIGCPPLWIKNKKGGCDPGPKHPYILAKNAALKAGFKEQGCGEIWNIAGLGDLGTNFYKDSEVFHISLNPWEDEEIIDAMKEKYE